MFPLGQQKLATFQAGQAELSHQFEGFIMYNAAIIAVLFAATFESLIITVGNIFTIFVFCEHRNRLKRTFFLLINLTVADLFVGFTEIISLGVFNIPGHFEKTNFNSAQNTNIWTAFEISFSYASVFFLALISLERACALIWPLRHRVASTKVFIYSAFFAWLAAVLVGTLTVVALYDILDYTYLIIAVGCVKLLCLVTICASYLVIRIRLNRRVPAIDGAHNIQQNLKLSRTLFIMITASLLFWIPSLVVYVTNVVCSTCVPLLVFQIFNLFRLANSLVNPIIYSFRIPMFRETFKRMKLCKQSKKYKVNYTPRNSIEDRSESALPRPQTSFVELSAVRMESWAGC